MEESMVSENNQNPPIHGDVLESIFACVPLIDLVPASHVSKGWNRGVFYSLRHVKTPKPWLILHAPSTRANSTNVMRAYDPRTNTWIKIECRPLIKLDTVLRSSNPNLLYSLTPSKFSFSIDPLHLRWHHVNPPKVWRVDPIVVSIGRYIILAGGSCDFEEAPLAVEMYDPDSAMWTTCEPMPTVFEHSSSATWVSTATDGYNLFMMEKQIGAMHTFDTNTKTWSEPLDLSFQDLNIYYSEIAFLNNRLILIGLLGEAESVTGLKLWEVDGDRINELTEMPIELLEKLMLQNSPLTSIGINSSGNFLYIYSNCFKMEEIVVCELVDGGCAWRSIKNVAASARVVFTCSKVGFGDVQTAMRSENLKITHLL